MEPLLIGAALLNGYAVVLVLLRAPAYRTQVYRPMLWNVWLSIAPVLILGVGGVAGTLLLLASPVAGYCVLAAVGLVWLLMLPNASYLITELNLSHRESDERVPLWYDIILVISLAMSGVINTILNVFLAHVFLATSLFGDTGEELLRPSVLTGVGVVLLLLAFGMYLGRYPRVNSWDIKHPLAFARKLAAHFREPTHLAACAGFTLTYAVFLAIMYVIVAGSILEGVIRLELSREIVPQ